MFGLPWETTIIMGLSVLFWIAYTLVFYFSTKSWESEDPDYENVTSAIDEEAMR